MDAIILTIGDELLYGQTVDTNSAFMGRELAKIGVRVHEIVSVSDSAAHIVQALDTAKNKADIILTTGGLGPTKDDLTKLTLAKYFNTELVMNQEILDLLEGYFKKRGVDMLPAHRDQALMPAACTPLRNDRGTAWGMWFEQNGKVIVSMPGVPREMVGLMQQQVLPKIKGHFQLPAILHRHINTAGLGESYIADKIKDIEESLPAYIKLAYLPEIGMVRLRLTAQGDDMEALQQQVNHYSNLIETAIEKHIYGFEDVTLEKSIGSLLIEDKSHISTAESCTGGAIASRITTVPGSSHYFNGSAVTYTEEIKHKVLGVSKQTIETYGVVSEQTVIEMVKGACTLFSSQYAIAVSGIAGPEGGTEQTPVGTMWIAVGSPDKIVAKMHTFPGDREMNTKLATILALEMMRKFLKGYLN